MKKIIGFSLIELLMILAIIGVLSSIAVPSYHHYIAKAKLTNLVQEASSLSTLLQDYIAYWETFGAHYRGWSSVNMNHLGEDLSHVKQLVDADPNFHFIKMWSGQCKLPGLTVLIAPHNSGTKPLIGGGATQYVIRYDLSGKFVGIAPAPWGGRINNAPWWPDHGVFANQVLEAKVKNDNGAWKEHCVK